MSRDYQLKALNKFLKVASISNKKEEAKAKSSSSGIRDLKGENSIDNLDVAQMLYIDDFFFMLGHYATDHNQNEYLFLTKGNEIKDHFKLHSKTLAVRKVNLKEAKLIVSLGYDNVPQEDEDGNYVASDIDVLGKDMH
jgi:hypothetical protein